MGTTASIHIALVLAAILTWAPARTEDTAQAPIDQGLTENVETRLVQFELRVARKGIPVRGLGVKDLDIELGGKPLREFTLDDVCGGANISGTVPSRPGSFLLYFDGPELTLEGRRRAVEVARRVAPALLNQGHELLILLNGTTLRAETNWTRDAAEISSALDRVATDPGDGETGRADAEELHAMRLIERAEELVHDSEASRNQAQDDANSEIANGAKYGPPPPKGGAMTPPPGGPARSPVGAMTPAAKQKFEEARIYNKSGNQTIMGLASELDSVVNATLQRNERDIDRLSQAVRSLALRGSPKGVVYFADTLRRDPGGVVQRAMESVTNLTNRDAGRQGIPGPQIRGAVSSWNSEPALTALVRDASTYGVRFYAVEGRGLTVPSNWVRTSQDTLASIALDTGGVSFVNGVAPERIAEKVAADQSCWYLVSFRPHGWEADRRLDLGVWPKEKALRAQVASALVIPSPERLARDRLLAAHVGDPTIEGEPLSVSIYPVGGTAKALQVLAQVRMPDGRGQETGETAWEVGLEVVSHGKVVSKDARRVSWRASTPPPVFQTMMLLPAGPYELIAVAQQSATQSIRSGRVTGSWPPTADDKILLSRPALAQPQKGGIVLDGEVKQTGVVVRADGALIDPRAPVAFVTAACVSGATGTVYRAERRLVGETEVSFAPTTVSSDEGRCVQIRDLVAARSLGAGRLTYFVRILSGDAEIATQELGFDVAEVADVAPK